MSYVIDRPIMDFVEQERKRCRDLVVAIQHRPFLLFCIDAPVSADEDLKLWAKRFEELGGEDLKPWAKRFEELGGEERVRVAADLDIEDLM